MVSDNYKKEDDDQRGVQYFSKTVMRFIFYNLSRGCIIITQNQII